MEEEERSKIDCYVCGKPVKNNEFICFCSPECKEKYAVEHFQPRPDGPKYKTIQACQKRLEEMRIEAGKRRVEEKQADDMYEQAKAIFG